MGSRPTLKNLKSLRKALADSTRDVTMAIDEMQDVMDSSKSIPSGLDDALKNLEMAEEYVRAASACTAKAQTAYRQHYPEEQVLDDSKPYDTMMDGYPPNRSQEFKARRNMARTNKIVRMTTGE